MVRLIRNNCIYYDIYDIPLTWLSNKDPSEIYGNLTDYYSFLFSKYTYPLSSYIEYSGGGPDSYYSSSISISDNYIVVAANGYQGFQGALYIYKALTLTRWTQLATLASPIQDIMNFGFSIDLDGRTLVVGAPNYGELADVIFTVCIICARTSLSVSLDYFN